MAGHQRIEWLDGMKGIGILIVMLSHFCSLPLIYKAGYMPLFFFAAGFTYKPSFSYLDTIKKKGKRLLTPWLVYGLLIYIVELSYSLVSHTFSMPHSLKNLVGQLYMRSAFYWPYNNILHGSLLTTNSPMWFLCTLFCVFVYMTSYERCHRKWLFVSGLILLAFLTFHLPIQFPWGMELALVGTLIMLVAIRFKKNIIDRNREKITIMFVFVTICYCFLTYYNGPVDMLRRSYGLHGYFSVLIFFVQGILYSLTILSMCRLIEKTLMLKALAYVGRNSMRLLCIHIFIVEYTQILLKKTIPSSEDWSEYLMAGVYVMYVIGINEILNRLFVKYENQYAFLKWI